MIKDTPLPSLTQRISAFSISAFAHPKDTNLLNMSLRSPCPKDFSISTSLYLTRENRKRAGTQLKATGLSRVRTEHSNLKVSIIRTTLIRSKIPPAYSGPKEDSEDDDNEEDSRSFPDDTRTASSSSCYRETAHLTGYHCQQEIPALTKEMEYGECNSITTTNTREVRKYTTRDIINITEIIFRIIQQPWNHSASPSLHDKCNDGKSSGNNFVHPDQPVNHARK